MQRTEITRRSLLAGAVLFLAGCTGRDDSNGAENSDAGDDNAGTDEVPTESEVDDETHLDQYESYLRDEQIPVNDLQVDEDERIVSIEYESQHTHEEELAAEMGVVAGGYMQRLEEHWEMDRLAATIYDDEKPIATWQMETEWFEEMEADERTPEELSVSMIGTLELLSD